MLLEISPDDQRMIAGIRTLTKIYAQRSIAASDTHRFGDPSWNILLDLTLSHFESKRISVSSASIASGAPGTTALRHLTRLEDAGFISSYSIFPNRRTRWIEITPAGLLLIRQAFASVDLAPTLPQRIQS
jgi:DNA-binding MarR family transcriptional regulator